MHHKLLRKRFFAYVQISVLFVGAVYLLFRHDILPIPTTWSGPSYTVEPWQRDPTGDKQISTGAAAEGHEMGFMPSSVPDTRPADREDAHQETLPAAREPPGEEEEGWITLYSSDKMHEPEQQHDAKEDSGSNDEKAEAVMQEEETADNTTTAEEPVDSSTAHVEAPKPTKKELTTKAHSYIASILDPDDTSIDRMFCPPMNTTRYAYLQASEPERDPMYFIALNLRKCVDLLPRLLGSLFEVLHFLGPERCAVSIVEGNSDDGTLEVLELLEEEFERLGVKYYLRSTPLDPSAGQRIEKLAMLRAMAVAPVTGVYTPDTDPDAPDFSSTTTTGSTTPQLQLADGATVLFLNDVAACPDDMLELLHQRALQGADMTCAMDWTHPGPDPFFYDVWISRALNGDIFFDIPAATGSWDNATDLFWNEPVARRRLGARKPFQVFACWNGAAAFTAAPLARREVSFRASAAGECFQGEPQLFCKDMWYKGYGKIMVVPGVNLEYTDEAGRRTKKEKGYVGEWIADEQEEKDGEALMVPWQVEPPEMVKCMPSFTNQTWLPWDESLPLSGDMGSL